MRRTAFITALSLGLFAAVAVSAPLTKQRALAIMHERHEGMEDVGKNNKVLRRELTANSRSSIEDLENNSREML